MITSYDPYPICSIGRFMSAAAREQSLKTGTAPAVTAIAAFASGAAAVQGIFDVQRPNLPPSPISVLSFVSAESGIGKSTGAKPFVAPHEAMQRRLDEQSEDQHEFETAQFHWREELAYQRMKQRRLRDEDKDSEHVKAAIDTLFRNKPTRRKSIQVLYENSTPVGLSKGLADWPFAFVVSMDGNRVINGTVGRADDLMNSGWDGESNRSKTADENFTAYDPRITALVFTQPGPALRYFKRWGEDALGSGLLARADWAFLPANQPFDQPCSSPPRNESVDVFQSRVIDLLETCHHSTTSKTGTRRPVGFTQDAANHFRDLRQRTAALCNPGKQLQGLNGYAAKIAERVARFACIAHVFDDVPGLITAEELWHGEQIAQWYSRQLLGVLAEISPQTQAHRDAQQLELLICQGLYRGESVRIADLSRIAPPDWGRPRRLKAWQVLQHSGRACLRQYRHTHYIQLVSMPQQVQIIQN